MTTTTTTTFACNKCSSTLPLAAFSASSLKWGIHRCTKCNRVKNQMNYQVRRARAIRARARPAKASDILARPVTALTVGELLSVLRKVMGGLPRPSAPQRPLEAGAQRLCTAAASAPVAVGCASV